MISITLNRAAYRSVMLALGMAWTGEPIAEEPFPTIVAKLAPALCGPAEVGHEAWRTVINGPASGDCIMFCGSRWEREWCEESARSHVARSPHVLGYVVEYRPYPAAPWRVLSSVTVRSPAALEVCHA